MVEISIILYLLFIIDFIGERKRKHGWKLKCIGTSVGKEKKISIY
jgi:hypothetical protein